MDRRPARALPRMLRRPLALVARLVARDGLYVALSLGLLLVVSLVLYALSPPPLLYPPLADRAPNRNAASGTTPHLEGLLQRVSPNASRLVVAVAVNYAFRDLALNFVCNLHRLRIPNYIVLAMDRPVYRYLSAHGANVFFYEDTPRRRLLADPGGDRFGSTAFVETSRRKSLLVLKVLRLGYSVVFSDVDVVWVRDPIPHLVAHPFDFVMQSDRNHNDRDAALNYNLNSGFYLARASSRSVMALRAIVKYAVVIRRSEQKAFNYVLCGAFKDHHAGPGTRVGAQECTYRKGGATVIALPLDDFPNGSNDAIWLNRSTPFINAYPSVVAVHANYVEGMANKVDRIKRIGFWLHSEVSARPDGCLLPPQR